MTLDPVESERRIKACKKRYREEHREELREKDRQRSHSLTHRVKKLEAYHRRRERMAKVGVPLHSKPGRPRKYFTQAEAYAAKLASQRASAQRMRALYRERIQAISSVNPIDPPSDL